MGTFLSPKQQVAMVDRAVAALMEQFDCVQILASHSDHEGTHDVMRGGGNWYARQGLAREFMERDRAQTEANELKKVLPDHE